MKLWIFKNVTLLFAYKICYVGTFMSRTSEWFHFVADNVQFIPLKNLCRPSALYSFIQKKIVSVW